MTIKLDLKTLWSIFKGILWGVLGLAIVGFLLGLLGLWIFVFAFVVTLDIPVWARLLICSLVVLLPLGKLVEVLDE